jgi:hypothetical protein
MTTAGGEVNDGAGAPGWGEGTDAATMPDAPPAAAGWNHTVDRPTAARRVALVVVLLLVAAGVTWFGAAQVDVEWALASGAAAGVAGVMAWRGFAGWAYLPMLGAWACAVVAVVHGSELLRWRGWQDIAGWVGGWLTALLWVGGVVFATLLLVGAFDDGPAPPDDWADGV